MTRRNIIILAALTLFGLLLRLLVWRWREFYALGGDEAEYFEQALSLLRGDGYRELQLMRPPLYTVFLAVVFQLFNSQVQRVRLVQALISTATIPLFYLWARELFWGYRSRDAIALASAALAACSYTFAANATELLTETLFVGGLVLALWSILLAARLRLARIAACAGVIAGLLCLLRSVALPLIPLAALYLLGSSFEFRVSSPAIPGLNTRNTWGTPPDPRPAGGFPTSSRHAVLCSLFFVLCSLLIIAPWTLRNYLRYDALIVVDTTGAENLWLDNDPAGREAVKRQLYELGDDRNLRQRLALERGREAIVSDLPRFFSKAWSEAVNIVALEYFDDLRERRAIWVRPVDVWLRLVLGDAVWLLALFAGSAGLWLARPARAGRADPRWLLVPWALYVVVTGLVFHVELRYRLPLYPVLLPFAAYVVEQAASGHPVTLSPSRPHLIRAFGALLTVAAILGLLFAQRNYAAESVMLARKHWNLRQAHQAVLRDQASAAHLSAERALALDPESALARVYLGLSSTGDEAAGWWREAIDVLPAHPYAHLLLGDALRAAGEDAAARAELAYETASLEDLQRWSRTMFKHGTSAELDIGGGLDLGAIGGFHAAQNGTRWTKRLSEIHVSPAGSSTLLRLRSPRPANAPPAHVDVLVDGELIKRAEIGSQWQELDVPSTRSSQAPVVVTLRSDTFRPRDYNRADPDNRELGIEVDWAK